MLGVFPKSLSDWRPHNWSVAHQLGGLLEKNAAGRVLPLRIAGRKIAADIALADRPEHGITNRVQQHVSIRVTVQPLRVLDLHASKPKRSPLNKAMYIVTYSGMNHGRIIVSYLGWPRANIAIPAATEALSELTRPCCSIPTTSSAMFRMNCPTERSSPPMTSSSFS